MGERLLSYRLWDPSEHIGNKQGEASGVRADAESKTELQERKKEQNPDLRLRWLTQTA